MSKTTLSLSVLAIIISVFAYFKPSPNTDLVYVDLNKLIEGYNRTKIEQAKFEDKAKRLQGNVDSLVNNFQKELVLYEKERSSMSKKEIELKQELLSNKQQQINNYQQAVQTQIQEEDQNATQTVLNDINDYVKEYGKKNNYKIIFGATGGGSIMYAEKSTDLTEDILMGLNNQTQ